jgi:hypothetical protein
MYHDLTKTESRNYCASFARTNPRINKAPEEPPGGMTYARPCLANRARVRRPAIKVLGTQ